MPTIKDIERLAKRLMKKKFTFISGDKEYKMSANELGYTFGFMDEKKTLGYCHYINKTIELSRPICENNFDKLDTEIKDIILHEIAHAFCVAIYGRRKGGGHDKKWKQIARGIGCNGNRCYDWEVKTPKGKYTLSCPNDDCDYQYEMYRKPRVERSCGKCSQGVYNPKYKLVITENK